MGTIKKHKTDIFFIVAWFLVLLFQSQETVATTGLASTSSQLSKGEDANVLEAQSSSEILYFQTDYLPNSIIVPGDPLNRAITSFKLQGKFIEGENGEGLITFDESIISFNEFGDPTKVEDTAVEPCPVTFYLVKGIDPEEKRCLYELIFADGTFPHRIYLVFSKAKYHPHRLLIRNGENLEPIREDNLYEKLRRWGGPGGMKPAYILNLRGPTRLGPILPNGPLGSTINFKTIHKRHTILRQLTIRGTLNGPASLYLDPNNIFFNKFADLAGHTLIYGDPIEAVLKKVIITDPAEKGRSLFEVVPTNRNPEHKYFLVLSPTEAGPHRLIVWEDSKIFQILPLLNPHRQYQLKMQAELINKVSPREQRAIAELQKILKHDFRFEIEADKVVFLFIPSGDEPDRITSELESFSNLKRLGLQSLRLTIVGLKSIGNLKSLEELTFYNCYGFTADGFSHLQKLENLRVLHFSNGGRECLTDAELATFEGFTNLEELEIGGPGITDNGLRHLEDLFNLKILQLTNNEITDAGLEYLRGLINLEELSLSGQGITDVGLETLESLSSLQTLYLISTRITPAGKAKLKSALPMLEIHSP